MTPTTPKTKEAPVEFVTFTTWHNGYRAGERAAFSPEEAARLCDVEKVAARDLTEAQRGKAEAAAEKEAEAQAKADEKQAKADEKQAKADEKKGHRGGY